ncbi:MAG TPA: carbon starvation protein A, partial [Leptospiraceae bacterium]|nr:carbon starvation protein A [Leptospiraceae bacterium]
IRKNPLFTFLPMVFILFVTLWAMIENFIEFISPKTQSLMLAAVGGVLILLTLWLAVEGILVYLHLRKKHRLGE